MCHPYIKKFGATTFGESKTLYFQSKNDEHEWKLGKDNVDEVYQYVNLGVLTNCVGSFTSNLTENIEKAREKAGVISPKFDRHHVNPPSK